MRRMSEPDDRSKPTWRESPPVIAREGCARCHGTGWELAGETARRCTCAALSRLVALRESVRIPRQYEDCSLENFEPETVSQQRALNQAKKFLNAYPHPGRDLFLSGPGGSGKAHLAVGIAREVFHRYGESVLFVDFGSIAGLGRSLSATSGWEQGEWDKVVHVPLLILHRFGTLNPSPDNLATVDELLEARWGMNKPTVYTGGDFRCRDLFRRKPPEGASMTYLFLSELSQQTLMRFLSKVKVVQVAGEGELQSGEPGTSLF